MVRAKNDTRAGSRSPVVSKRTASSCQSRSRSPTSSSRNRLRNGILGRTSTCNPATLIEPTKLWADTLPVPRVLARLDRQVLPVPDSVQRTGLLVGQRQNRAAVLAQLDSVRRLDGHGGQGLKVVCARRDLVRRHGGVTERHQAHERLRIKCGRQVTAPHPLRHRCQGVTGGAGGLCDLRSRPGRCPSGRQPGTVQYQAPAISMSWPVVRMSPTLMLSTSMPMSRPRPRNSGSASACAWASIALPLRHTQSGQCRRHQGHVLGSGPVITGPRAAQCRARRRRHVPRPHAHPRRLRCSLGLCHRRRCHRTLPPGRGAPSPASNRKCAIRSGSPKNWSSMNGSMLYSQMRRRRSR